jgi:hypothetical protein
VRAITVKDFNSRNWQSGAGSTSVEFFATAGGNIPVIEMSRHLDYSNCDEEMSAESLVHESFAYLLRRIDVKGAILNLQRLKGIDQELVRCLRSYQNAWLAQGCVLPVIVNQDIPRETRQELLEFGSGEVKSIDEGLEFIEKRIGRTDRHGETVDGHPKTKGEWPLFANSKVVIGPSLGRVILGLLVAMSVTPGLAVIVAAFVAGGVFAIIFERLLWR